MNLYTPSCHANYAPIPAPTTNTHNHPLPRRRLYDAATHTLEQPHPPSLREILAAYRMKGDGDREMLLAILQAKTAEDQRIAATTRLHQTLLQINFVPSDDFTPGGAPLPPHFPHERVERPIVHPKFNDPPSSTVRRPSPSPSTHNYPPTQARPTPPRHSPEERRHSNGWTTAILSPSSGAESVDEEVTYQGTPSIKGNANATPHSSAGSPPETEPRGMGADRVMPMSIGTLLSSHGHGYPNTSYERRGAAGHGMDVDQEEQARRGRKYD